MSVLKLLHPTPLQVPAYIRALERGYRPSTTGGAGLAARMLDEARHRPHELLAATEDPEARAAPVTLPDGSTRPRIPGLQRWIWDSDDDADIDGFSGGVGLRWMPGHAPLPPHVLGHIGYSVVPWKRRRGYATRALALLLPLARAQGMAFVDITTDPDNAASQKVIAANGGILVERFTKDAVYGATPGLRWRIGLA